MIEVGIILIYALAIYLTGMASVKTLAWWYNARHKKANNGAS